MTKQLATGWNPDQMLHSVASDLGLHCLPFTLFGVSILKLVGKLVVDKIYSWHDLHEIPYSTYLPRRALRFFKITGKLVAKYVSTDTKGTLKQRSVKDLLNDAYVMLLCFIFFSDFLYKSICCGYSFELHQQDAIQMVTHNICLYKEVDKKYTGCNLKTMELLDCALIITKTCLLTYIENFTSKKWKFSDKNSGIFHISAQNIDCGYSLELSWRGGYKEYAQSMVLAELRKIMYTHVNPSFTI